MLFTPWRRQIAQFTRTDVVIKVAADRVLVAGCCAAELADDEPTASF